MAGEGAPPCGVLDIKKYPPVPTATLERRDSDVEVVDVEHGLLPAYSYYTIVISF